MITSWYSSSSMIPPFTSPCSPENNDLDQGLIDREVPLSSPTQIHTMNSTNTTITARYNLRCTTPFRNLTSAVSFSLTQATHAFTHKHTPASLSPPSTPRSTTYTTHHFPNSLQHHTARNLNIFCNVQDHSTGSNGVLPDQPRKSNVMRHRSQSAGMNNVRFAPSRVGRHFLPSRRCRNFAAKALGPVCERQRRRRGFAKLYSWWRKPLNVCGG
jgi:hypothetical protein